VQTIVVLEGDQTGQELLEEAVRTLAPDVIGVELGFVRFDLSLDGRRATRNGVVYEAAAAIREHGHGLKAATVTPEDAGDVTHRRHHWTGRALRIALPEFLSWVTASHSLGHAEGADRPLRQLGEQPISLPGGWPEILDFLGTLLIEFSPGQFPSDAGLLPFHLLGRLSGLARAFSNALHRLTPARSGPPHRVEFVSRSSARRTHRPTR